MCETAAMKSVDKVDHASDAITKCGFDFKMDFLQKPDAAASSLTGADTSSSSLPQIDIIGHGDAKAPQVGGDAKAPEALGQAKTPDLESKKLNNDGPDHEPATKNHETQKPNKNDYLPKFDSLEIPIRHN